MVTILLAGSNADGNLGHVAESAAAPHGPYDVLEVGLGYGPPIQFAVLVVVQEVAGLIGVVGFDERLADERVQMSRGP